MRFIITKHYDYDGEHSVLKLLSRVDLRLHIHCQVKQLIDHTPKARKYMQIIIEQINILKHF